MTVVRSGSASDVGRVRSANEDRLLESGSLFAVADGMGGHAGGEVAAALAIEVLQQRFATDPSARGLVEAVRRANLAVWERSHQDAEVRGMGTTLTVAALVPTAAGDRLIVANVGDSRAYRYAGGRLVQMTTDHSVAEELVARGELSEAEAAVHPHRHILTRALGVGPEVDVDAWELAPTQGERFVLCSDGLTNEVSTERIAAVLHDVHDPRQAARTLVGLANEHGGNDNVTVVVLDVVVADPVPGPGDGTAEAAAGGAVTGGTARGEGGAMASALVAGGAVAGAGEGRGARPGAPGAEQAAGPSSEHSGGGEPGRRPRPAGQGGPGGGSGADPAAPAAGGGAASGRTRAVRTVSSRPVPAGGGAPAGVARAGGVGTAVRAPSASPTSSGSVDAGPDTMARHVTGALSDVMGRRSALRVAALGGSVGRHRGRRLTVRVAFFVLLVAAVGAGAGALVHYYAEDAWFVRFDGARVAVYQGRPGGFLGFEPKVLEVTDLTTSDVLAYRLPELRGGVQEPTRQAAHQFVANLRAEFCAVHAGATVCAPAAPAGGSPVGSPTGTAGSPTASAGSSTVSSAGPPMPSPGGRGTA